MWLSEDMEHMKRVMGICKDIFPVVRFASTAVPSYTTGHIGLLLASKNKVCLSSAIPCGLLLAHPN